MSDKKWYVIRAISGKEKKVKQYIESEIYSNLKLNLKFLKLSNMHPNSVGTQSSPHNTIRFLNFKF